MKKNARTLRCAAERHPQVTTVCMSLQGDSDPRYCLACEDRADSMSHRHEGPCPTISISTLRSLILKDPCSTRKLVLDQQYRQMVGYVHKTKRSLDELLRSYFQYVENLKNKLTVSHKFRQLSQKIKDGAWEGLKCSDIGRLSLELEQMEVNAYKLDLYIQSVKKQMAQIMDIKLQQLGKVVEYFRVLSRFKNIPQITNISQMYEVSKQDIWGRYPNVVNISRGQILLRMQEFSLAEEEAKRCLSAGPNLFQDYSFLGRIRMERDRDLNKALEYFQKAFKIKSCIATLSWVVQVHLALQQYEKAYQYLSQFLHQSPNDWQAHSIMGQVSQSLGRYQQAISALTKSIQFCRPNYCERNYQTRARLYEKIGDPQRATADRNFILKQKEIQSRKR